VSKIRKAFAIASSIRDHSLRLGLGLRLGFGLAFGLAFSVQASAQDVLPISLRDSFPIGSNGLCEAQIMAPEEGAGLFDRRYSVVCRDASAPIGTLWVVRGRMQNGSLDRFTGLGSNCDESNVEEMPSGVDAPKALICTRDGSIIRTRLLVGESGNRTYAASGFSAYEDALRLGLSTLALDKIAQGDVEIPLTQSTDAAAFARTQAEAISADQALVEGYRRSNRGKFADAAEFFATSAGALSGNSAVEARLNQGLLYSNLGKFDEAIRLFNSVRAEASQDAVLARMLRNFEALDALNSGSGSAALQVLNAPLVIDFGDPAALRNLRIEPAMASRLSAENTQKLGRLSTSLSQLERAQLLDGQGQYLRGAALRLQGRPTDAAKALASASQTLAEVRGGRVVSMVWLRAQILSERAEIAERSGNIVQSSQYHQQGIALLESSYPGSPALLSAKAQLAGLLARTGQSADALTLYRELVGDAEGKPAPALRGLLSPYFSLLVGEETSAIAAREIFSAAQLLQRPGLAQTQAILARELSGGSDEASQLFRKTTNIGRAIERLRGSIQQMDLGGELTPEASILLAERNEQLDQLLLQQAELQQQLAAYPRYRAVSDDALTLDGLRKILRDGEAYVKLVTLDKSSYVIYATPSNALAWRANATPDDLESLVNNIRDSIAITDGAEVQTRPFDIGRSRELYLRLFEPVADILPTNEHIVFEPDGAMLKLPLNLLVTDDESVIRYQQRAAQGDGDPYDFRGTAWLGRNSVVSTSVSPTSFRDVRASRNSTAKNAYIGFGQNKPIDGSGTSNVGVRSALAGGEKCLWSPSIWNNPIAADELRVAANRLAGGVGEQAKVLTGVEFSDSSIKSMDDLNDYRILHFATHGLVTAPQPECPPRPALLTSFGEGESDGLLTFAEIFSLQIDADLVILSACDTAGNATAGTTLEAGITTGGDFALDGLVRAFVGAGGRTILASHWPVPDDFNATQRLITGLFDENAGNTATALRQSQIALMDDADTSHPFYWSAFAIVGDGTIDIQQ